MFTNEACLFKRNRCHSHFLLVQNLEETNLEGTSKIGKSQREMEIPLDFYLTQRVSSCGFFMPSSSVLSGLKDGKAIGVVDEDAPEEPGSQDSVEPLFKGILPGCGAEEGHTGQFE
jgi:hypothetical protein